MSTINSQVAFAALDAFRESHPNTNSFEQILTFSEEEFVETFLPDFDDDPRKARQVYREAQQLNEKIVLLWANIKDTVASPSVAQGLFNNINISESFIRYQQSIPSYNRFFGNLDYREYDACRSIFGPAAYFVDLLRFIETHVPQTGPKAPLEEHILAKRQPGLFTIPLDCDNTFTLIPYIDLINEVLEGVVGDAQTSAEETIEAAHFPMNLLIHLPLEEVRLYLNQLKLDLQNIYTLFGLVEPHIVREILSLSPREYPLLKSQITSKGELERFYGIDNIYDTGRDSLENVDIFATQTGLSRSDLNDLLLGNLNQEEIVAGLSRLFFVNNAGDGNEHLQIEEDYNEKLFDFAILPDEIINLDNRVLTSKLKQKLSSQSEVSLDQDSDITVENLESEHHWELVEGDTKVQDLIYHSTASHLIVLDLKSQFECKNLPDEIFQLGARELPQSLRDQVEKSLKTRLLDLGNSVWTGPGADDIFANEPPNFSWNLRILSEQDQELSLTFEYVSEENQISIHISFALSTTPANSFELSQGNLPQGLEEEVNSRFFDSEASDGVRSAPEQLTTHVVEREDPHLQWDVRDGSGTTVYEINFNWLSRNIRVKRFLRTPVENAVNHLNRGQQPLSLIRAFERETLFKDLNLEEFLVSANDFASASDADVHDSAGESEASDSETLTTWLLQNSLKGQTFHLTWAGDGALQVTQQLPDLPLLRSTDRLDRRELPESLKASLHDQLGIQPREADANTSNESSEEDEEIEDPWAEFYILVDEPGRAWRLWDGSQDVTYILTYDENETPGQVKVSALPFDRLVGLTPRKLDRIYRFLKLARRLDWSFADLDWAIRSFQGIETAETVLRFDGVNDFIDITNGADLPAATDKSTPTPMTLEAWVLPNRAGIHPILAKGISADDGAGKNLTVFSWWITPEGKLVFFQGPAAEDGAEYVLKTGSYPFEEITVDGETTLNQIDNDDVQGLNLVGERSLPLGTFSHVAVTVNAAVEIEITNDAAGETERRTYYQVAFYINGSLDSTWSLKRPLSLHAKSEDQANVHIYLGKDFNHHGFAGQMADVRLWQTLRSSSEITDHRFRRCHGRETGLAAYWPLVESLDLQVQDFAIAHSNLGSLDDAWNRHPGILGGHSHYAMPLWTKGTLALAPLPRPVAFSHHPHFSGYRYHFNGRDTYVGNQVDLLSLSELTIEAWVELAEASHHPLLFLQANQEDAMAASTSPGQHGFWINGSNQLVFSSELLTADLISEANLELNRLTHVAVSVSSNGIELFIDGNAAGSHPGILLNLSGQGTLYLGRDCATDPVDGNILNGTLQEVRIWNVARTPDIARFQQLTGAEQGLVGYWRLDEPNPYQVMARDRTDNANHLYPGGLLSTYQPQLTQRDQVILPDPVESSAVVLDFAADRYPVALNNQRRRGLGHREQFTLQFWFRAQYPSPGNAQLLFGQGESEVGLAIYLANGQLHAYAWCADFDGSTATNTRYWVHLSGDTITANQWHHVTLTYDETAAAGIELRLYCDSQPLGRTTDGFRLDPIGNSCLGGLTAECAVRIFNPATRSDGGAVTTGLGFTGQLTDLRIWRVALPEAELFTSRRSHPHLVPADDADLVCYAPLTGDYGRSVSDHAGPRYVEESPDGPELPDQSRNRHHGRLFVGPDPVEPKWQDASDLPVFPHRVMALAQGQFLRLPDVGNLGLLDHAFTVELWVRLNQPLESSTLLVAPGVQFGVTADGVYIQNGEETFTVPWPGDATGGNAATSAWRHLAWRYADQTHTLFMDGQIVGEPLSTNGITTDGPVYLGMSGVDGATVDLQISELRIWKIARSTSDIQQHWNRTLLDVPAELVARWSAADEPTQSFVDRGDQAFVAQVEVSPEASQDIPWPTANPVPPTFERQSHGLRFGDITGVTPDFIDLPSYSIPAAGTLEFWIQFHETETGVLFDASTTSPEGTALPFVVAIQQGTIRFDVADRSGTVTSVQLSLTDSAGLISHLAVTWQFDPDQSQVYLGLIVNDREAFAVGNAEGQKPDFGSPMLGLNHTQDLNAMLPLHGVMVQVRAWMQVMSFHAIQRWVEADLNGTEPELLFCLPLDDATGFDVRNLIPSPLGKVRTLSVPHPEPRWVVADYAIDFDGQQDKVLSDFVPGSEGTIELWAKFDLEPGGESRTARTLFDSSDDTLSRQSGHRKGKDKYFFLAVVDQSLQFRIEATTGDREVFAVLDLSSIPNFNQTWHHITATWTYRPGEIVCSLSIDNQEPQENRRSLGGGDRNNVLPEFQPLYIGYNREYHPPEFELIPFDGQIRQVRIWTGESDSRTLDLDLPINEGSGTTLNSSVSDRTATLEVTEGTSPEGKWAAVDRALEFAGFSNPTFAPETFVVCPTPLPPNQGTLELWAQFNPSGNERLLLDASTLETQFQLAIANGSLSFRAGSGEVSLELPAEAEPFNQLWHHIAATWSWDDVSQQLSLQLHLNNQSAALVTVPQTAQVLPQNPYLGIARLASPTLEGYRAFDGSISQLRIWTRVKPFETLQQQRYTELSGTESGLVSYLPIVEEPENRLQDSVAGREDSQLQLGIFASPGWQRTEQFPQLFPFGNGRGIVLPPAIFDILSRENSTVEIWAKLDDVAGTQPILGTIGPKVNPAAETFKLEVVDGIFQATLWGQTISFAPDQPLEVDTWYRFGIQVDHTQEELRLAVDGNVSEQFISLAESVTFDLDRHLYVGWQRQWNRATQIWASTHLRGTVAEIRVWANLNGSDSSAVTRRLRGDEPDLVANWILTQTTQTTLVGAGSPPVRAYAINALNPITQMVSRRDQQPPIFTSRTAPQLDGYNDYLALGDTALDLSTPFSIEFWLKAAADDQAAWQHIAALYGTQSRLTYLYINGKAVSSKHRETWESRLRVFLSNAPEGEHPEEVSAGQVAEFRLWQGRRLVADIRANRHRQLSGREPNLGGYWPLNDGAGDRLRDQAEYLAPATLITGLENAAEKWQLAQWSDNAESALFLDGMDDHARLPDLSELSLEGDFTLEAWVYPAPSNLAAKQPIFGRGVELTGADDVVFCVGLDGGSPSFELGNQQLKADQALEAGKWHHLAWRYVVESQTVAIFINGNPWTQQKLEQASTVLANGLTGAAAIGWSQTWNATQNAAESHYFAGGIGQVRLWKVARTQEQIQNYQRPLPGDRTVFDILVADWIFDDRNETLLYASQSSPNNRYTLSWSSDMDTNQPIWTPIIDHPILHQALSKTALSFDGQRQYGAISNLVLPEADWTIEVWVQIADLQTRRPILWWGLVPEAGVPTTDMELRISETGHLELIIGSELAAGGDSALTLDQPNHVAVVLKGEELSLFVNGESVGSGTLAGELPRRDRTLYLGRGEAGTPALFNGLLQALRIWQGAKTDGTHLQTEFYFPVSALDEDLAGAWSLSTIEISEPKLTEDDRQVVPNQLEAAPDLELGGLIHSRKPSAGEPEAFLDARRLVLTLPTTAAALADLQLPMLGEPQHTHRTRRTIEVWFCCPNPFKSDRQLLYFEGDDQQGLQIYIQQGKLTFTGFSREEQNQEEQKRSWQGSTLFTERIQANHWHHAALVLDGRAELRDDAFCALLDGRVIGLKPGSQLWGHPTEITVGGITFVKPPATGADSEEAAEFEVSLPEDAPQLHGQIAEVRIWEQARSQTDLTAPNNLSVNSDAPGLLWHWKTSEVPADLVPWRAPMKVPELSDIGFSSPSLPLADLADLRQLKAAFDQSVDGLSPLWSDLRYVGAEEITPFDRLFNPSGTAEADRWYYTDRHPWQVASSEPDQRQIRTRLMSALRVSSQADLLRMATTVSGKEIIDETRIVLDGPTLTNFYRIKLLSSLLRFSVPDVLVLIEILQQHPEAGTPPISSLSELTIQDVKTLKSRADWMQATGIDLSEYRFLTENRQDNRVTVPFTDTVLINSMTDLLDVVRAASITPTSFVTEQVSESASGKLYNLLKDRAEIKLPLSASDNTTDPNQQTPIGIAHNLPQWEKMSQQEREDWYLDPIFLSLGWIELNLTEIRERFPELIQNIEQEINQKSLNQEASNPEEADNKALSQNDLSSEHFKRTIDALKNQGVDLIDVASLPLLEGLTIPDGLKNVNDDLENSNTIKILWKALRQKGLLNEKGFIATEDSNDYSIDNLKSLFEEAPQSADLIPLRDLLESRRQAQVTIPNAIHELLSTQQQSLAETIETSFSELLETTRDRLQPLLKLTEGHTFNDGRLKVDAVLRSAQDIAASQTADPESDLVADLNQLYKTLFLLSQFNFSSEETVALLSAPDLWGLQPTSLVHPTFEDLNRLYLFNQLKANLNDAGNQLLSVLQNPDRLYDLTEWSPSDVKLITAALNLVEAPTNTLPVLSQLAQAFAIIQTLGADAQYLISLADISNLDVSFYQGHVGALYNLVRAKYDDSQWGNVYKPLHDRLATRRRDALLAYVLEDLSDVLGNRKDPNVLYEYLLLDVQTGSEVDTSRIVQATASLQLYVQRCLMDLEMGVQPEQIPTDEWEWMKNYRVWEANRKVFLYPENYIEPELRDTKTPAFQELEDELQQSEVSQETAETAYKRYLNKFADVTNLTIVGSYVDTDDIFTQTTSALEFDGTEYLKVGENLAAIANQVRQNFTVAMWVKPVDTQSRGLLSAYNWTRSEQKGWCLRTDNGKFLFHLSTDDNQKQNERGRLIRLSSSEYVLNRWYHVAVTYENHSLKLYINGKKVGKSTERSGPIYYPSLNNSRIQFALGALIDEDSDHRFKGEMRQVEIWNVARTETQIRQSRARGVIDPSHRNLVHYWPMDETGDEMEIQDMAGSANLSLVNKTGITRISVPNSSLLPRSEIEIEKTLYLVGRNDNTQEHYFRKWINERHWESWQKIDIAINAKNVSPVFAFNRLFLFWAEIPNSVRAQERRWVGNNDEDRPVDQLGHEIQLKENAPKLTLTLRNGDTINTDKAERTSDGGTLNSRTFVFSNKNGFVEVVNAPIYKPVIKYSYSNFTGEWIQPQVLPIKQLEDKELTEWQYHQPEWQRIYAQRWRTSEVSAPIQPKPTPIEDLKVSELVDGSSVSQTLGTFDTSKLTLSFWLRVEDSGTASGTLAPLHQSLVLFNYDSSNLKAELNQQSQEISGAKERKAAVSASLQAMKAIKNAVRAIQDFRNDVESATLPIATEFDLVRTEITNSVAADIGNALELVQEVQVLLDILLSQNIPSIISIAAQAGKVTENTSDNAVQIHADLASRIFELVEKAVVAATYANSIIANDPTPTINELKAASDARNDAEDDKERANDNIPSGEGESATGSASTVISATNDAISNALVSLEHIYTILTQANNTEAAKPNFTRGKLELGLTIGSKTQNITDDLAFGTWHHVALLLNFLTPGDSTGSHYVCNGYIYPDNTSDPITLEFKDANKLLVPDQVMTIGDQNNPVKPEDETTQYKSLLSEFRLWNYLRTPSNIDADRNKRLYGRESGLELHDPLHSQSDFPKQKDEQLTLLQCYPPTVTSIPRERIVFLYGDGIVHTVRNNLKDIGYRYSLGAVEEDSLALAINKEDTGALVGLDNQAPVSLESYVEGEIHLIDRFLPTDREFLLDEIGKTPEADYVPSELEKQADSWGDSSVDQLLLRQTGNTTQFDIDESYILDIHNQPNWFVVDIGDEIFLVRMFPDQWYVQTFEERLQANKIGGEASKEFELIFNTDYSLQRENSSQVNFEFLRLNTFAVQQLSELLLTGIDNLLNLDTQIAVQEPDFGNLIPDPKKPVDYINLVGYLPELDEDKRNPIDFNGAYGIYYQEIFFHAPFLIANQLNANQKFAESQCWYHYIFNPMAKESKIDSYWTKNTKDRYWRYRPFRGQDLETLSEMLANEDALDAYRKDPFDPHTIARLRINTYQKVVVMKYIANLIDWGDYLFRQDSRESITEATQLYVLAATLLGPRPKSRPIRELHPVGTYEDIHDSLEDRQLEELPGFLLNGHKPEVKPQIPFDPNRSVLTHFGVPENAQFIGYWDTVDDRLYKIRHSLNIDGVFRSQALFQPPIDPAALVNAAASGISGGFSSALASGGAVVPHYRFGVTISSAKDMLDYVIDFGSALVEAIENRGEEELNLLQHAHEQKILEMTTEVKKLDITQAEKNLNALQTSLESANQRCRYYDRIINEEGGRGISPLEHAELGLKWTAYAINIPASVLKVLSAATTVIPKITIGASGAGGSPVATVEAGKEVTESAWKTAAFWEEFANLVDRTADMIGKHAEYARRKEEWEQTQTEIGNEIVEIEHQIVEAEAQVAAAGQELLIHQQSIDHHKEVGDFHRRKFFNKDLRNWLANRLSSLYFQAYKIAFDLAKQAEWAYQFEFGSNDTYLRFGYWDSRHKGLLAGESLRLDLMRLEKAAHDQDSRYMEITKTISLARLDPLAFLTLRETGRCQFSLSEMLFDRDFPGHYFRIIKSVALSIPAVVGPYENVHAMLIQTGHKTLLSPDINGVKYLLGELQEMPDSIRVDWRANQKIAVSNGIEDTGMFELDFNDDRYLPFENTGAVSNWILELPRVTNRFDFETITDVIIHLRYMCNADSGGFRQSVMELDAFKNQRGSRLFSLAHEFSAQWFALNQASSDNYKMHFTLPTNTIPPNLTLNEVGVSIVLFKMTSQDTLEPLGGKDFEVSTDISAQPIQVTLTMKKFEKQEAKNLLMLVKYEGTVDVG